MEYESVIGLEIHTELDTRTKMFCDSLNDPDEKHPNVNICPVCMGHPGTLPVANKSAVKKVMLTGLALNGEVQEYSRFDRKNYFYPDLPKGYQISQYKYPLVLGGYLEISGRKIRITRIHLEEDTGRLVHDKSGVTLVDFNRAGVPLMELVTEPDLHSGKEIKEFGEKLQQILRYIDVSDADMEKGELRVEVNMSLREKGKYEYGVKVEIKNINSFKFAADAVGYEIKRQTELLENGEKIVQETRGWDENKKQTFSQRSKEEAHDYRYFPEPDLPPLQFSREEIEALRVELPELAEAKRERLAREYQIDHDFAELISSDKELAAYFEKVMSEILEKSKEEGEGPLVQYGKNVTAFLTGDFLRLLNQSLASAADTLITPENMAELVFYAARDKISSTAAKQVLAEMFRAGGDPSDIIGKLGLWQMNDTSDIENIAKHIISENPKAVEDYKKGNEGAIQFLVGQVMKQSRGKANPKIAQEIVKRLL